MFSHYLFLIPATITMGLAGTVNGWTKTSLVHLTTGSGDVPLMLTEDESSWVVSLTVLGSMIGSLLTVQLADRSGRKYCLLVCSTMFTIGWFIIYEATSVPKLYLAGVTLGIGVGIAHTINPMFVSEIADIKYRGSLGALIAANANSGTLLSYALALWLTYKSQVLLLVITSFASLLPISRFPESPYFLMAKGQKEQARLSIAYYKDIEDPRKVKIEQRVLRDQVSHELQQQFGDELHQQSGSDLHSQSRRDLPPQSRSDLPSQSRRDLPPQSRSDLPSQSRSDLPSQSRSDLPSQSRREAHSDSFWTVVDTEPMSYLNLPSSSDSLPQSTPVINSAVIYEVHLQPTDELLIQSTRKLHSQSTSELQLPTASKIHRSFAGEIHRPSTSENHSKSTSELHQPSTSEIHRTSTTRSDFRTQSNVDSRASTDIPETYIGVTKYTCLTKLRALLQRSNRNALFIMLGLIMAQQLSGNSTITRYLEELIGRDAAFMDLHEARILVQAVPCVCGYSMTVIVTYIGRRTLLFLSTIGSCISLLLLAGYHFLHVHKFVDPTTSILPVYFLNWYHLFFHVGLGVLPNVLLCELFPAELKGIIGAIVVIFNGLIGFIASKLYQVITDNVEWYAISFSFATSCWVAFVMVFIWVPETKGKTNSEIEALLVSENWNCLNQEVSTDEMDSREI
ncbi:facilitated trehalose transporter Tret1-like [Bombus bifarius]|uniref:Facilitated trehalose transporter Tret1-like n=1 Tax=Bombus bifarius TaxID=103933 RepID=A0A6P8M3P3_9HYME|nr:facilitated trehalose transporter Tret1-like [Bombus bifarius]